MSYIKLRYLIAATVYSLFIFVCSNTSTKAASVLAAWLISNDGILKLRTSKDAKLEAFFQSGSGNTGDRIWIDFPGELSKPRKLKGNGAIKQIRLGKPYNGNTRLVIEFIPNISINPSNLQLKGVSPILWEMDLPIYSQGYKIKSIGEGNVDKPYVKANHRTRRSKSYSKVLNINLLPDVQRNRFLVVIDPGHGGPDTGALGINGLREKDINFDISKSVAKFLTDKGVQVKLTRYRDVDVNLNQRVLIANKSNADAFISIHANASRGHKREISGIETFFHSGYRGKKLAMKIQNELISVPGGSPNRGVKQSRFYVIGQTNMPAALVEVGFVTGRLDARLLSQQNQRKELAFAISKGILEFLKETY